jgi:hypothetical protein
MTGDRPLRDDPKGTIGGYVSYRAHSCPHCKALIYDEILGAKQLPHICSTESSRSGKAAMLDVIEHIMKEKV